MHLSSIFYYPLKSGHAIETTSHPLSSGGLALDRKYMLIDEENGKFVSLRDKQADKLVQIEIVADYPNLEIQFQGKKISLENKSNDAEITYRDHEMIVSDMGEETASIFSEILGKPVRLVHSKTDRGYGKNGISSNGMPDEYLLLIANQASLDSLQQHFHGDSIGMARFRPNLVIEGAKPFEEDHWQILEIGGVQYEIIQPCQRCAITTKDPQTAARHDKGEPLNTLSKLRKGFTETADGRKRPGAFFGVHAKPLNLQEQCSVNIGDNVTVLESSQTPHPVMAEAKLRFEG